MQRREGRSRNIKMKIKKAVDSSPISAIVFTEIHSKGLREQLSALCINSANNLNTLESVHLCTVKSSMCFSLLCVTALPKSVAFHNERKSDRQTNI